MSETVRSEACSLASRDADFDVSGIAVAALGSGLLFFLGWSWNSPVAAWLAPLFLIRFFRTRKTWRGTLIAIPMMLLAMYLAMTGLWPLSTGFEIGVNIARLLPFLAALYADRFFARRLGDVGCSLVYPAAFVFSDYLLAQVGPVGVVFSPGSTQFGVGSLVQLVSVTGLWGLVFVTGWFAATPNGLWAAGFDVRARGRSVGVFAGVLLAVLLVGSLRLSAFAPAGETVRVGSVAVGDGGFDIPTDGSYRDEAELAALHDSLYARSRNAVAAGARIVFWAEGNAAFFKDDEAAFLERAKSFARENQIYLAPGVIVIHPGEDYGENKILLIDPSGEILFSYEKANTHNNTRADGIIPVADTPYGRISAAICFDMDFPTYVNQLGDQGVDIMLVPSWDNEGIKPYHTETGLFRAVENGFSMVRHVGKGASAAVDHRGSLRDESR